MNFTAKTRSGKELTVEATINDEYKPEYRLADYDEIVTFKNVDGTPAIHLNAAQLKSIFNVDGKGGLLALVDYSEWEQDAIIEKLENENPEIKLSVSYHFGTHVLSDIDLPHPMIEFELTEMYKKDKLEFVNVSDDYTKIDYQLRINYKNLIEKVEEYKDKKKEKTEKHEVKIAEAKKEAATNNTNVEISKASVPCDGSVCECSLDIITEYVTPAGEVKTERIHTF